MDITRVEILHDRVVRLRFSDGFERTIDLAPYLGGPLLGALLVDAAAFAAVTVDSEAGTIVWPNGADLAPDVLYGALTSARMQAEVQRG